MSHRQTGSIPTVPNGHLLLGYVAEVEHSGRTLSVDSGAGQGTTFVAVLPRADVADYLT
jgi:hypothetical protein